MNGEWLEFRRGVSLICFVSVEGQGVVNAISPRGLPEVGEACPRNLSPRRSLRGTSQLPKSRRKASRRASSVQAALPPYLHVALAWILTPLPPRLYHWDMGLRLP